MKSWCILLVHVVVGVSEEITQRKIYTLFTNPKSWNEASAICETQFGQLVKIQYQRDIEELVHLDEAEWSGRIHNEFATSGFWSGLHSPFINSSWEYQDCEPVSADVTVLMSNSTEKCATVENGYTLRGTDCATEHLFICQRYVGDCWFEPFYEEQPEPFLTASYEPKTAPDKEASTCALYCRNFYENTSSSECWGFTYYPITGLCLLHHNNSVDASSQYLEAENRAVGQPGSTFYIRRCFEGTLDAKTYANYQDTSSKPNTNCTITPYINSNTAGEVCYCSTQGHPPIPDPASSEEKARQYEETLIMDTRNTSAAIRRLSCAEDTRPSAIGVGYVGTGLLTVVFVGLLLLDLNALLAGIKERVCSARV